MLLDLHSHSTYSDGTYKPEDLILLAKEKNLELYSITDHDNIDAQKEAIEFAKKYDVNYITGVEISCKFKNMFDLLGYGIDINNEKLISTLNRIQDYRKNRNNLMIERLKELGFEITLDEVAEEAQGDVIGRPHFARVLLKKGYVKDREEAFDKYLGDGKLAYIPKQKLQPEEAVSLIKQAGGYPVIAHPKYLKLSPSKLIDLIYYLKPFGLWGIEVYYSKHTRKEIEIFKDIALKTGLMITAGSDFHGENKPEIDLGMSVEDEYLKKSIDVLKG
ncbi:phosphoesterase [Marinitoga sp. 1135]|uniref:Putative metal-dependent phosphoesterase, PHP family n=1 Tax=Marinitoga piezophila (strain DSM 14283 / JCM 11233 / KA3) TaxID=443254 RepID=H2J3F6_MARPK|nr:MULTISPECIES: PHP domain-containing protein [Marinitoga]AEX85772.1 putative metal-dependent phosphoesterase, PHP family [Marinitoga piezophila KA3]APT76214.1 phosphoesterase [Marinitoga sp. 1137]NUU95973.1 phosphoesterase [Marinitoga sp. 1135]NUU97885.1 phosphoesterase [Marinitoga sp. 1138]